MNEKEMLQKWLTKLHVSLKETNDEIKELEDKMMDNQKLHEIQLVRLNRWLSDENLEHHIKDELEYAREFVERIPHEDERKLVDLKNNRDATLFMIEQIERELRG